MKHGINYVMLHLDSSWLAAASATSHMAVATESRFVSISCCNAPFCCASWINAEEHPHSFAQATTSWAICLYFLRKSLRLQQPNMLESRMKRKMKYFLLHLVSNCLAASSAASSLNNKDISPMMITWLVPPRRVLCVLVDSVCNYTLLQVKYFFLFITF